MTVVEVEGESVVDQSSATYIDGNAGVLNERAESHRRDRVDSCAANAA
jgi:hypothetical protein